ncbi:cobalt/nickel transport system permease protein/energy-coupling factor transport system permease protein [Seinonella peptonophila]|uniref:Cobalt/nickel transport system permease protein/energy-coupling factor transport system permease protein n=1 Tax=Seinonella peptonophila TaxID=112248 RepID=A0A1M5B9V0_9BACL|nr:energy-coupling factor transporter transmembrane component T [Seinonella peptonophila]SHF39186.1 cobalt/nickel transport system permease protein/energy-coupling factor transport system permease protein [Seinonella peptonophila]
MAGDNILKLNPLTKITFAICLSISVFFADYPYALGCFIVLCFIAGFYRILKDYLIMLLKTLFIIIIFMFILQALFYPGHEIVWQWKFISIKQEGLMYALSLSSKILVIGGSILLFFKTTHVKDLVSSLEQVGLSPAFAYVILSTLQIIPQMEKRSRQIMDAQRSRGVETEGNLLSRAKAFIPSLGPLILSSIVGTEERAITLEARAFSAPVKKVRAHVVKETPTDKWLRILFISLLILFMIWRVVLWII